MQLKVARILNSILIIITGVILGLGAIYFFWFRDAYPEYKFFYLIGYGLVSILLLFAFKQMEARWDKRVITKMAINGKLALANITSAKRAMPMRDSSFTSYWLYEFQADVYDAQHKCIKRNFYEKMNVETDRIPEGTVYITYDESKPNQIFVVPNVMISHIPSLMPLVAAYEKDKSIKIKYLDVYYNKGMVIKTFKQTLKENTPKGQ